MRHADETPVETDLDESREARSAGWFAAGGVMGAIVVSSCCILPLALVTLGISGAWIGNLTALEPYKPYTLTVTALLLAGGFWHVYFRPEKACADGSYCARPGSEKITETVLWLATVIAVLAATINAGFAASFRS